MKLIEFFSFSGSMSKTGDFDLDFDSSFVPGWKVVFFLPTLYDQTLALGFEEKFLAYLSVEYALLLV